MGKSTKSLQDQLVDKLSELCAELDLVIGLPHGETGGCLIGTREFIAKMGNIVLEEDYDSYKSSGDKLVEVPVTAPIKKNKIDPSWH